MPISFDADKQQFHLYNQQVSYIMELVNHQYLIQVYYGQHIQTFNQVAAFPRQDRSSFSPNPHNLSNQGFSLDIALQEAPGFNAGDYREGLVEVLYPDGTAATNLTFLDYQIIQGKPSLIGLPATYVQQDTEADTLKIRLQDEYRQLIVTLNYTIYANRAVITKSVQYHNASNGMMVLQKALSACFDISESNFDLLQLPGAWAKEKQIKRDSLTPGIHLLNSKRGASSVQQQPFIALLDKNATEFSGEVRAFHLIYSGNFEITTEVDAYEQTRILAGINPYNFSWPLKPDETFQTPEVVMVYSNAGLNEMSQTFHQLYRERLARGRFQLEERPVLTNNWETTYFDFDEDHLLKLVDSAKQLGIELFVLDDGWFGKRNSDTTSLGDWQANLQKLPHGLKNLADQVHAKGLQFGLWFEPEMISEESTLFKQHPDWHLHVKDYPSSLGRNQLILDFSREDVREYIYAQLTQILDNVPIDYIKWDMNRNMTEVGSTDRAPIYQQTTSHRYILGLYAFLEHLTKRYPNILFENCSGGAGRFDPGMVYYMPQSWTSDNTDPIERLKIQYSTSLIFPPVMMCAHLSDSPNHQTGRYTDLETRAAISMSGNLGIMLDFKKQSRSTLAQLKSDVDWYLAHRQLIQFGQFFRLADPYNTNYGAWQFDDGQQGVVVFTEILASASKPWYKLKLTGLEENARYQINEQQLSGAELMHYGLFINHDLTGDFQSKIIEYQKIK